MKKTIVTVLCELPLIQAFAWSVLTGVVGALILAGFLSTLIYPTTLSILMPLIAGINAAFSGYMLIERNGPQIVSKRRLATAVGLVVALLCVVAANMISLRLADFYLLSIAHGMAAAGTGILGGWAGGTLADKYLKLKEQAPAL